MIVKVFLHLSDAFPKSVKTAKWSRVSIGETFSRARYEPTEWWTGKGEESSLELFLFTSSPF
jgi:hypothetical protein